MKHFALIRNCNSSGDRQNKQTANNQEQKLRNKKDQRQFEEYLQHCLKSQVISVNLITSAVEMKIAAQLGSFLFLSHYLEKIEKIKAPKKL